MSSIVTPVLTGMFIPAFPWPAFPWASVFIGLYLWLVWGWFGDTSVDGGLLSILRLSGARILGRIDYR
jgi:hypothetical protein